MEREVPVGQSAKCKVNAEVNMQKDESRILCDAKEEKRTKKEAKIERSLFRSSGGSLFSFRFVRSLRAPQ
jgi:hypothetical protein